jgi:hypothetical protein
MAMTVHHVCISCGYEIKEHQREEMIREHGNPRYYHINYEDCQESMRRSDKWVIFHNRPNVKGGESYG